MSAPAPGVSGAADPPRWQPRLILWVPLALVLVVGSSLALAARVFDNSFQAIESDATEQKARQLYRALNADLRQLEISNRDYAEWDDAADFVASHDPKFLAGNFSPDTLKGMHVDLVWITDRDGHELYSGVLDDDALHSPAPARLLTPLARLMHGDRALRQRAPAERLLRTERGLAAFSVIEVTRSNRSAATGTYMLFVRYIGDDDIARVRDAVEMPLTYTYLPTTPAAASALSPALRAWAAEPRATATRVLLDSEQRITGNTLVRDLDGRPAAVLSTSAPRSIHALGTHTTRLLLGGIALLLLAAGSGVLWLVQRLRRGVAARQKAARRYASIAAQLQEGIMIVDAESLRIVEANAALRRTLGLSDAQLRTRTAIDIYPDLSTAQLDAARRHSGERTVHQSRLRSEGGAMLDAEVSVTRLEGHEPAVLCLVGHDITHRREAELQQRASNRRLAHMAQHDPLTGLPNRLYLRARLPRALRYAAAADKLLGLIYLDVDHFKNINDSRGHGVGDELLKIVAQRLRAAVGAQDVVVRMGGDEFVIVASLLPDAEAVDGIAQRLQAAVQAPLSLDEGSLSVSASMGIALYPADGLDMESLLKHADIALYQAKEAGRRCHRRFSQEMLVRVSENVALEQALRRAVGTRQLTMDYQPIIDLRTGRVASLEALMRWRHPSLGLIPPSQFIPIAESTGLTAEIGTHALHEVLGQLRDWLDAEVPVVPIAVNISPVQLETENFADMVAKLAAQYRVEAHWLRFEITETAFLKDAERLAGTLQILRTMGSQILIDDFGTGYSGLSHLARLPVDSLKIDRSFINDVGRAEAGASIVGAVIDMAKKLKLSTVAEGVETQAQAMLLRDQGCDFAQGYHFSKPVSARHCKALLTQLGWEQPLTATLLTRTLRSA